MFVSKTTILLLIFVLLLSIFLSCVNNVIKYDREDLSDSTLHHNITVKNGKTIGQNLEDMVWFVQVSDLHISIFRDSSRISEFQDFCLKTIGTIKPTVVLASGDLTDAKQKNNMGSTQHKLEWEHYSNTLIKTNITEVTTWLDLRGNHDNFNVPGINSTVNYYKKYSIQGELHPQSYLHIAEKNKTKIAFLGVDACPQPGLRRPFNFIGILNLQEQNNIKKLSVEANSKASHIVWFSHYPSSCILWLNGLNNKTDGLRELIGSYKNSLVHLVGHLHRMGGFVPQMYALQHPGYLELEVGDWKDSRLFRLAAIDHGIFSFVDEQHGTWPLILITNPKHAAFNMPTREPLYMVRTSSHIRILVFSLSEIKSVEVRILGQKKGKWTNCFYVTAPLYTCKWDPSKVLFGIHYIEATAIDMQGRKRTIIQPFSLDDSRIHFGILPRLILMGNASSMFQYIFSTLILISVIPISILRISATMPTGNWRKLRILWMLSKIGRLYYPLVLYPAYLAFGPWSIGEIIENHIGIIFAWGIFVNGSFIPDSFTYLYGSVQLMIVHLPLVLILAKCVERRLKFQCIIAQYSETGESFPVQHKSKIKQILAHTPFIFVLSMQMLFAYLFWLSYGTLAFLIGPMRTWPIFLSVILWYQALTLPMSATRELLKICFPNMSS